MSKWHQSEIEYLINNHFNKTVNQLAIDLDRSVNSIKSCLRRLDIKPKAERNDWTMEELDILKRKDLKVKEKIKLLPRHPAESVKEKHKETNKLG